MSSPTHLCILQNRSSARYPSCFHPLISLASAARNPGEEASAEPDRGPGARGTLHASVVLSGCPLVQPGEEGANKGAEALIARFGHLQMPGASELWRTGCFMSGPFHVGEGPLLDPFMWGWAFLLRASFFQFQIATVTEKGVEIEGPLSAETNWDIAHMIR